MFPATYQAHFPFSVGNVHVSPAPSVGALRTSRAALFVCLPGTTEYAGVDQDTSAVHCIMDDSRQAPPMEGARESPRVSAAACAASDAEAVATVGEKGRYGNWWCLQGEGSGEAGRLVGVREEFQQDEGVVVQRFQNFQVCFAVDGVVFCVPQGGQLPQVVEGGLDEEPIQFGFPFRGGSQSGTFVAEDGDDAFARC